MKVKFTLLTILVFLMFITFDQQTPLAVSNVAGAPAGHTGSPFDNKTCAKSGCHSGTASALPGLITSNIPVNGYAPGNTYTITCSATQSGINKWGFQVSPMGNTGILIGTPVITNATTTKITFSKYVTHTTAGTTGAGTKTWSFDWVAPSTGTGPVTFYGAFNYANGNGNTSGDLIRTSTLTVQENTTGVEEQNNHFSLFQVYPNPVKTLLFVNFGLIQNHVADIQVTNISGALVKHIRSANTNSDNNKTEINMENLPSGIYFVTLSSGSEKITKKISKI